jgi:glycosyltransferase involved in cell wall biosynthesis
MRDQDRCAPAAARRAAVWLPPPESGSATNPYTWLLYDALSEYGVPQTEIGNLGFRSLWRARHTVRFLHFHWRPDRCYAPSLGLRRTVRRRALLRALVQLGRFRLLLAWARVLGFRIIWTVHEVRPPRSGIAARLDRSGLRLLAHASSLLFAHNPATSIRLQAELGLQLRFEIVPHPTFKGVYPSAPPADEVRAALDIPLDAFVFLCFGQLRADKHIALLLEAFDGLELPDAKLVIAGAPVDRASADFARIVAEDDRRIRLMLEQVSDDQVAGLFEIADAFVLPRSEVWTSGSLVLSLSMGLPAVAADLEPTTDLLGDGDAGWLFAPGDVDSLRAALLLAAADRDLRSGKRAAAQRRGDMLPGWDQLAAQTASLFAQLDAGSPTPAVRAPGLAGTPPPVSVSEDV